MNNGQAFQDYTLQQKEYKIAEFQTRNFGFTVYEVMRKDFIERVFGNYEGHICLMQITSGGKVRHAFREREGLENSLDKLFSYGFTKDTYLSYSTYFRSKKNHRKDKLRTQSNIVHTHMLVQDLDFYKIGMSDAEFLQSLGKMILDGELICPNYLISTGRGYQLVWIVKPFKNIEGFKNDRDWRLIQDYMYDVLKRFESDDVVKNPSAVTRLPDSIHSKTGNRVYAYLVSEQSLTLKDFLFYYDIVPTADRSVKPKKIKTNNSVTRLLGSWNEFTLNRQREEDIFIFVRVQNQRGISYVGKRNWLALVLRFHALVSSNGDREYAYQRVVDLCNEMDMIDTTEMEILRRSEPAERYYEDWLNGTWNRDKYLQGGLFYKNATILDLLDIKDDYYLQWKMKTIKIKNNKYEAARKHFERLEKGQIKGSMKQYNESRSTKVQNLMIEVKRLLDEGLKQKEIAEMLNMSTGRVSQLVKKIRSQKV